MPSQPIHIFIGVAWPYVNGDIHLGHLAGYLLPADFFARFNRFIGNEVLMVSGSDCHGTPTTIEADKRGLTPEDIVNEYHPKHEALMATIGMSFDLYTRTDNPTHERVAQDLFAVLVEKDLVYRKTSDQYYSESERRFLPDRYVEGECPHCHDTEARSDQCDTCGRVLSQGELINPISKQTLQPVTMKPTEHYFLDWPTLEPFLKTYVAGRGAAWRPWIRRESERWLTEGLKGRAITRDIDWGVKIPADRLSPDRLIKGHEHKRLYVWFEAVIGYLSASIKLSEESEGGLDWKTFWHNEAARHYYFAGKDNLVFHTLFWPGQLHAYDETLNLPDVPAVNQFLTLNDQAFSKSFGITLDPRKMLRDFDLDLIRFYLCLIMPENSDSDFSWNDFITKTNNLLIANIGNFLFRALKLSENIDFSAAAPDQAVLDTAEQALRDARELIADCKFKAYAERILEFSAFANKYLSDTAPWTVRKTDEKQAAEILAGAMGAALALAILLTPLIPASAVRLAAMLGVTLDRWPKSGELKTLVARVRVSDPQPLFKKIEIDPADFDQQYR